MGHNFKNDPAKRVGRLVGRMGVQAAYHEIQGQIEFLEKKSQPLSNNCADALVWAKQCLNELKKYPKNY